MNPWMTAALGAGSATAAGFGAAYLYARRKGMHRWLGKYMRTSGKRRMPEPGRSIHLLLCVADHFEPKLGNAPPHIARERVQRWVEEYPKLFVTFRDSDGQMPRHTFFYPAEAYEPEYLDALADLCRD